MNRRRFRSMAWLTACALALAPPVAAQPSAAKPHLAAGAVAAKKKDWEASRRAYEAAMKAAPSAAAFEGLGRALVELGAFGEAYDLYDTYLRELGKRLPAKVRVAAEKRRAELEEKTGLLVVEASEAGAEVTVDDVARGSTPLARPLRLTAAPHRVRVTKSGFLPFDQVPAVTSGHTTRVSAKLTEEKRKAVVAVTEKGGQRVRVVLDGVDVGEAPWSGEVEPGPHEVLGRGVGLAAPAQTVEATVGKTASVVLEAVESHATLKLATSDGAGVLYVDGKVVGEGTFTGELVAGRHSIAAHRDGYERFQDTVTLAENETLSRVITLKLADGGSKSIEEEARAEEGLYGGLGLLGTVMPWGTHNDLQERCEASSKPAELIGCSGARSNLGGGLSGYVGFHMSRLIGLELFLGGHYDQTSPTLRFSASSLDLGPGPDPAREERFTIRRFGGHGALRIRMSTGGERVRLSLAGGVGVGYRSLILVREAESTAGGRDRFVPDAQSYLSPLLSVEPTVQWRVSPSFALAFGAQMIMENAQLFTGQVATLPDGSRRLLGGSALPVGISTPGYRLVEGPQIYLGPYVGVQFGP